MRFLAVLELYKQGRVDLVQFTNFGDLTVRRLHADESLDLGALDVDDWDEPSADTVSAPGVVDDEVEHDMGARS